MLLLRDNIPRSGGPVPASPQMAQNREPGRLPGALQSLRELPLRFANCLKPGYAEPFVRFSLRGVETFVLFEPELIRHCFIRNAANYEQSPTRLRYVRPIFGESLMTGTNARARQLRKSVAGIFAPDRMRQFCQAMDARSRKEAGLLARRLDGPVIMADEAARMTLSNLSAALFSGGFDDHLGELVASANRIYAAYHPRDLEADDAAALYIPTIDRTERDEAVSTMRGIVGRLVSERLAVGPVGDDLLDRLIAFSLQHHDAGEQRDRIVDNAMSFLIAGHETTASTVSWALYLLTRHPDAMSRATAEADALLAKGRRPLDWVDEAPFIAACIEETLRLYPIVPILAREAAKPDMLGEIGVPAGSVIMIAARLLHRQHRHFPEPDLFDPRRFLPANRHAIDRMTYLPFAIGPRNCIGAAFGLQEAVIVTARLLRQFSVEYAGEDEPGTQMRVICRSGNGIPMHFTPRT